MPEFSFKINPGRDVRQRAALHACGWLNSEPGCVSVREMSRYDYLASDSSLRTTLDRCNVDELKRLVTLLPGVTMKAPQRANSSAPWRLSPGGGVVQLWAQLKALEQSAVAEAVHSDDGTFDEGAFHAKYGALLCSKSRRESLVKNPTLLACLFTPSCREGVRCPMTCERSCGRLCPDQRPRN